MVTKLAGPFSDTWRFSTSPRSRLRLRPARRAALTITLIRAECSMISAQDDLSVSSGLGLAGFFPVGALRLRWRQGGSSVAEPNARGLLGLGAILRTYARQRLVEHGVTPAGGFRDNVPFEALDLVHRHAQSGHQHTCKAVLCDRTVLFGGLAQQRDRGGLVLRRAGSVIERDGVFDLGVDIVGQRR